MIDLLRIDEYKRLVELDPARDIEHWRNVKDITPQSDERWGYLTTKKNIFSRSKPGKQSSSYVKI